VIYSARPAYILSPESLLCDLPGKGNDEKGAFKDLDELPPCPPVSAARALLQARRGVEGVWEGLPEGFRSQEQEQEQEQEQIPPKPPPGGALVLPGLEPDQDDPDPQQSGPSDLEVVWAEYRGLQVGQGIRRGEKVTKDLRRPIKARLKESGLEAVLKVIRWAHTSNHERARMLRDGGYLGATLFRASKFPEYLSMAGGSGANGGQRRNDSAHDPDDSDEWVDPAHRPKRWADPWDNPRDWTESLRDRLREFVDRGELPDPEDEDLCWAQYGMGVQAYRWFHGVDPWRGTADDSPARRFRLKDLMGNWVWRRQHQDGPPVVEALAAHLEEQGLDLPDLDVQRQVAAQLLRSLRVDPAEHGLGEVGR